MPDIKTKDVVLGTIKTVDRSVLAGQRMKDAYVQTRNKAEHSVSSSESNSEEYAADRMSETAIEVTHEAAHQMNTLGQRVTNKAVSKPQTTPTQAASFTQNAQQPHQTTDGASPVIISDNNPATHQKQPSPKQTFIRRQQVKSVKEAKQAQTIPPQAPSQPAAPLKPAIKDASLFAGHSIKTAEEGGRTIKQSAGTAGRTIKTANHTVNTMEQTSSAAIKTVQTAFHMGQRKAIESARAAQRIRAAAEAAASTAKALAAATAKAAKAIIAAAQELIAAIVAGGWVVILMSILVVMCFAGMMFASDENDIEVLPVNEEVKVYEPLIQKYANEHGIGDYVLLIEAVMMLESGGHGTDPMQCSECPFNTLYPNTPCSITDPEYSINVGIQNLADCLHIAQSEGPLDIDAIKLALQGYNYGQGYITWAINKYGGYSKANAVEFSLKTAEQLGWERYGNMDYVPLVLQYYPLGQILYDPDTSVLIVEVARSQIGNIGGEPYWRWYGFTERVGWCACFVSWCADQCGYIEADLFPRFSGPEWGVYWFKQRGQWVGRQVTPAPGMIIFFDWDDPENGGQDGVTDHVGIVSHVENGIIYTIEGNSIGDSCRKCTRTVGNYQIMGYGVPIY